MRSSDVVEIVVGLAEAGVPVWIDGGWCIDALVGAQTREHNDLDIAVDRQHEPALRTWFVERGYRPTPTSDSSPWNYVLTDTAGRQVDVHVFAFEDGGDHIYGVAYPRDALMGHGVIDGVSVSCISPEWMFRFKTAYEPTASDLADVHLLAAAFGFDIPPTHRP